MRWFKAIVAWVRKLFTRATPVAVVAAPVVKAKVPVKMTERERVMRIGRRTLARFKTGW